MWDDYEWQYHQDARDEMAGEGLIALIELAVAIAAVVFVCAIAHFI